MLKNQNEEAKTKSLKECDDVEMVVEYDRVEQKYKEIIIRAQKKSEFNDEELEEQEKIIIEVGKLYQKFKQTDKLMRLISETRFLFEKFTKSKTAKIVKGLILSFEDIPNSLDLQIEATEIYVEWALSNKIIFLRQNFQLKLAELLYRKKSYQKSLVILGELLREFKKLDNKLSLVEIQLLESKIYHALMNFSRSKSSLTNARISANSIYCSTILQAELDCQSGILNAEEKDYKTAFSYFYESFEGFNLQEDPRAIKVLKYMLLSKIMLNEIHDVNKILEHKNSVKYKSRDLDAMKAIAVAYSDRSLKEFENSLLVFSEELNSDLIVKNHLNALYDNLLEQNLLKIIESYSCVEISHISKLVGLTTQKVEFKLSQMILDKVFYGILDQGNGTLTIFDEPKKNEAYESAIELIKNLSTSVDMIYEKTSQFNES